MMEMFFKYDPEHIIIQNYLQQIEKYVHSQLDIEKGWQQNNITEDENEFYSNQYL